MKLFYVTEVVGGFASSAALAFQHFKLLFSFIFYSLIAHHNIVYMVPKVRGGGRHPCVDSLSKTAWWCLEIFCHFTQVKEPFSLQDNLDITGYNLSEKYYQFCMNRNSFFPRFKVQKYVLSNVLEYQLKKKIWFVITLTFYYNIFNKMTFGRHFSEWLH